MASIEPPEGWIKTSALSAELVKLGVQATPRQLERWRSVGLLLPRPIQVPHGQGSTTWHPPHAARQALAIERALAEKDSFMFAGAILWLAGFEVSDAYWKKGIENAIRTVRGVSGAAKLFLRKQDDGPTFGEQAKSLGLRGGIITNISRRIGDDQLIRVFNIGAEIITGEFRDFGFESEAEEFSSAEAATRAFGFLTNGGNDPYGKGLWLGKGLEDALSNISKIFSRLTIKEIGHFDISEIADARRDLINGSKIAVCLYNSMNWIYGDNAFSLRFGNYVIQKSNIDMIYSYVLLFALLRRQSDDLMTSEEIATLARQAECNWLMSTYLRNLQAERPEFRKIIGPDRMKGVFTDSSSGRNLLKEVSNFEFPQPDFRPWDQWRKLSKTTTSPGLLAMSIGAPLTVDLADMLRSVNADGSR